MTVFVVAANVVLLTAALTSIVRHRGEWKP
jgi:hypothetical protein